jgi:hypothetical protein
MLNKITDFLDTRPWACVLLILACLLVVGAIEGP